MTCLPDYKAGDKIATQKAYSLALAELGHADERVIVLGGDPKNSISSEIFKKEHSERLIECFTAEQNWPVLHVVEPLLLLGLQLPF